MFCIPLQLNTENPFQVFITAKNVQDSRTLHRCTQILCTEQAYLISHSKPHFLACGNPFPLHTTAFSLCFATIPAFIPANFSQKTCRKWQSDAGGWACQEKIAINGVSSVTENPPLLYNNKSSTLSLLTHCRRLCSPDSRSQYDGTETDHLPMSVQRA